MNILYNFLFSVDLAKREKTQCGLWFLLVKHIQEANDLSDCASPVLKCFFCSWRENFLVVLSVETKFMLRNRKLSCFTVPCTHCDLTLKNSHGIWSSFFAKLHVLSSVDFCLLRLDTKLSWIKCQINFPNKSLIPVFCYIGLTCLFYIHKTATSTSEATHRCLNGYFLQWDHYTNDKVYLSRHAQRLEGVQWCGAWRSLCTHLLAAVGGVDPVVQAGFVSQPEDLLKQVFGEVLEGGFEDKVAYLSVLLVAVMAEVDEVLDVVVGTNVLDVLTETNRRMKSGWGTFLFDISLLEFSFV